MNNNILAFYSRVRGNEALMTELAQISSPEELGTRVVLMGKEMGIILTQDDVMSGLEHINEVITRAANPEELSDMELELIAAGSVHTTGTDDVAPKC
ncbi:hypothetical protein [Terasakiella sp.]|uniref:hypothetical protein n=1 Tax=Terasakiella sp. TaxID=2034861 RepID=UPI003AA825E8